MMMTIILNGSEPKPLGLKAKGKTFAEKRLSCRVLLRMFEGVWVILERAREDEEQMSK